MKIKIPILILGILILIVIASGTWLVLEGKKVEVLTDKTEYQKGESLKVNIKNNSTENICFSSCYPYLLEKKNAEWESYTYGQCQEDNINETCVNSEQIKTFEIALSRAQQGTHQIVIPVCADCELGEEFKKNQRFYSNEFTIKEKEMIVEMEVTIITDKTEYEQGETVKITVQNNNDKEKCLSLLNEYIVEKFEKEKWTEIERIWCPCDMMCNIPSPCSKNLQPNEIKVYEWNQTESKCNGSNTISNQVLAGMYRIKIIIDDDKTIYSNEFIIK